MLAEKLGGMTVAEMRERMSNDEYMSWCAWFTYQQAIANMKEV